MNPILVGIFQVLAGYGIGVDDVLNIIYTTGFLILLALVVLLAKKDCGG